MLKNIVRALITVLGAILGNGLFLLSVFGLNKAGVDVDAAFTQAQQFGVGVFFAIIFGILFFRLAPTISRSSGKFADNLERELRGVATDELIVGVIGLVIGLIIALLITQLYRMIQNQYLYTVVTIVTYIIFGYLGVIIGTRKVKVELSAVVQERTKGETVSFFSKGKKKYDGIPKIFDTSVIIDGRIAEIMKTGFLEGPIVIPEFVLVELRHIADSSDSLKRTRGRRGLDILNKIQEDYGVEIYNTDNEKSLKEIPEVDVKLLKLAQLMNGKVVTNDFNLNKVAAINGVSVLNINELANTLKPVVIPGEEMTVHLVKQGKDNSQAIAYLDDGTMIVVEDGRKMIGKTTDINVTSVLQTSAGRMIFGRLKKN